MQLAPRRASDGTVGSRIGLNRRFTSMRLYDYDASGNCYKVRLLLALLGTSYERVPVDIFAGDTLTYDFYVLDPTRETPVLELDDGRVITQTNAILWFLGHGTPFCPTRRSVRRRWSAGSRSSRNA